jgi:integrase
MLDKMKRHSDGRVFHGPRGGVLKPDTVRNVLIRDVIAPLAERFPSVPEEPGFVDGRLHSLRHYFCSMCANSGVPEPMLMDWLGHRHSLMVKRYYHPQREEAQRQLNKVRFADVPTQSSTPARALHATSGSESASPEGRPRASKASENEPGKGEPEAA